ncbi:hypothetical protein V5F53_11305 [Xanthobacter sp. V4C-4]|uniref:hypothetical protein n=1 Tax=Xanthobacter cornucopiae TaxID=3119924 RepID=UPI003727B4A9
MIRSIKLFVPIFCMVLVSPAHAQPRPEICNRSKSCFMTFNGPDRGFCEAYVEGKSCFMAFKDAVDIGWCQTIREGKSCFMALNGQERAQCEAGRIPREHRYWLRLCRR